MCLPLKKKKKNQFSPNTISCQYFVASFCQHIRKNKNKTVHGRKWYFDGENWFKDSTDVELPNGSVTNNSGLCPTNQNFN